MTKKLQPKTTFWNEKLLTKGKNPTAVKVTRDMATARAFQKLGLLANDAPLKEVVETYDKLYADSKLEGELYILVPLSKYFNVLDLFHAFAKAYCEGNEWIYDTLWSQYTLADFHLPQVGTEPVVRAMLTGDEDNDYNEKGLYLTNEVIEQQRKKGDVKKRAFIRHNQSLEIDFIDPMSYIILDAIRLELGEKPLDIDTWTHFVDMDNKTAGGSVCVPDADWISVWLRFDGSDVDDDWDGGGVRFSVGENLGTSASDLDLNLGAKS